MLVSNTREFHVNIQFIHIMFFVEKNENIERLVWQLHIEVLFGGGGDSAGLSRCTNVPP